MDIMFNGKLGARQYRVLLFIIDGQLWMYRPYVGYFDLGDAVYD
jgi:hypothetical protein